MFSLEGLKDMYIVSLYYLIAFGYFPQFEVLYHLLYIIGSALKERAQSRFHDLRPRLHHCPV